MNLFFITIGSFFGVLVVLFTIVAIRKWFFWHAVDGQILKHRVEKHFDEEGNKFFKFVIEYLYQVTDVGSFVGQDSIELRLAYHEEDETIQTMQEEYAHGSSIKIYYSPNNPELSSVDRGSGLHKFLGSILVLLVLFLGIYIYIYVTNIESS